MRFEDRNVPHSVKSFWWRPEERRFSILFWSNNFPSDKVRRGTVVLHRNIVPKQYTSEQVTFNCETNSLANAMNEVLLEKPFLLQPSDRFVSLTDSGFESYFSLSKDNLKEILRKK